MTKEVGWLFFLCFSVMLIIMTGFEIEIDALKKRIKQLEQRR